MHFTARPRSFGTELVEEGNSDHTHIPGLALATGIRVSHGTEPKRCHSVGAAAKAVDHYPVEGADDVTAFAEGPFFAIDHVEPVDGRDDFDPATRVIPHLDAVPEAVLAHHIVAAGDLERGQRPTILVEQAYADRSVHEPEATVAVIEACAFASHGFDAFAIVVEEA